MSSESIRRPSMSKRQARMGGKLPGGGLVGGFAGDGDAGGHGWSTRTPSWGLPWWVFWLGLAQEALLLRPRRCGWGVEFIRRNTRGMSIAAELSRPFSPAKADHNRLSQRNTEQPKMAPKRDGSPKLKQPALIPKFEPEEEAVKKFYTMYTVFPY